MIKGKAQVLDSNRRKRGPKGVKRYDNEFHCKTKRKKKEHDQEFQSKILSSRKVNLTLRKRQPGSLQSKVTHAHIYMWKYVMMYSYMCVCAQSFSHILPFVTPWTIAHQAPLSMGIFQARTLEWVAMPSSRGSSNPRDRTQVSHTAGRFFTAWATKEAHIHIYPLFNLLNG